MSWHEVHSRGLRAEALGARRRPCAPVPGAAAPSDENFAGALATNTRSYLTRRTTCRRTTSICPGFHTTQHAQEPRYYDARLPPCRSGGRSGTVSAKPRPVQIVTLVYYGLRDGTIRSKAIEAA